MPISEEHLALLKRQAELITKLKAVIASQQQALEQLGVTEHNENAPEVEASGYDSGCENEKKALNENAAKAGNRKQEAPKTDAERAAKNIEWTEPNEEEERNFMATKPWLGAMAPPTGWSWEESAKRDAAPAVELELEYVHGYRGRTCRNNLAYIGNGQIVYPVAAVCVVQTIANRKQAFFRAHDDDILCLAYHGASRTAASGQQGAKPPFYVWSVDKPSDPPLAKFTPHARGVVSVAFSADGKKVCSVGLDDEHSVAVSSLDTKTTLSITSGDTNPILHMSFNFTTGADANNEFVTVGEKHIHFWTLAGGALSKKKGLLGNKGEYQTFTCVSFTPQHTMVACAGGQVYAFEQNKLTAVLASHNGATNAIDFSSACNLVTGGRDGFVNVWDKTTLKNIKTIDMNKQDPCKGLNSVRAIWVTDDAPDTAIVGTITSSIYEVNIKTGKVTTIVLGHYGDLTKAAEYGELWGLATHPSKPYFATAGEDQTLRVWSIANRTQVARADTGGMACCAAFSPDGNYVAVGLDSGAFGVFHFQEGANGSLTEIVSVKKQKKRIQSIRYSPNGKVLALGCADNTAILYKVDGDDYTPGPKCKGNSSVILHLDFDVESKFLQTCSQSYELLFYEVETGNQVTASRSLKDTKWATFTSKLGWDVQGIWPKEADGSDINMVAKSRGGTLLATAEDSGLVKVFNYPCVGSGLDKTGSLKRRPDSVRGEGHSEHVTSVEWAANDSYLISTGGADLAVFQWKVNKK
jgi:microtubule-associated protein-like 6